MKQDKTTFTHRNTKFARGGCFFGAVKLTKNADPDKYRYSGYGIGFDSCSNFSVNSEWGKNVIVSGVDHSLSVHTNKRKKTS